MDEVWKPVVGYEELYEVSNLGNVRGIRRVGCTGENLVGQIDHGGYRVVMLTRNCKSKHCRVHRLVAQAFIPNEEGKRTVNHIDGVKTNNAVWNLEWATHGENHKHAYRIGLKVTTEKQRETARITGKRTCELNRRKTPVRSISARGEVCNYESAHEAARAVNGDASPILKCCKGQKRTYHHLKWEFQNAS